MSDYVELKTKEVTVRKRRQCEWCGEVIEVGERAWYRVYVYDGFATGYQHPECFDAMSNAPYDLNENLIYGWHPGDFVRGGYYPEPSEQVMLHFMHGHEHTHPG